VTVKIEPNDTLARVYPVEVPKPQPEQDRDQQVQPIEESAKSELQPDGAELRFTTDRETRRPVIRVVDRETEDVIEQIPRESWRPWPPSR
jgi:uncharacterized FlaG/YvyC family protein